MRAILTFVVTLLIAVGVYCADNMDANPTNRYVTLSWDNTDDPTVIGTRVYWATNTTNLSAFTAPFDDVMGTNNTITISNLTVGVTYSSYVVAFNAQGLESDPSNVIQFRPEEADEGEPIDYELTLAVATDTNVWASFSLLSAPTNGTLNGIAPNMTYLSGDIPGGTNSKDLFKYSVQESITNGGGSGDPVTSWVSVIVVPKPDNLVYIGSRLEWWTVGNFNNRSMANFDLKTFTNPPQPHFYRGYLVITNNGPGITDLRVKLDWWKSLTNVSTETIPMMTFTNPPIQFYRNFLIITNKPFFAPPPVCDVEMESNTIDSGETYTSFSADWISYFSSPFIAESSYTPCAVKLWFSRIGSPSGDIFVSLYDNDTDGTNDFPGVQLSDESVLSTSELTTERTPYLFDINNVDLELGTKYWVVVKVSDSGNVSNSVRWWRTGTAPVDVRFIMRSGNGTSWALETSNRQMWYIMYTTQ